MAARLTEHDTLSVLTADAIQKYMPGMRSDPFAFRRMLTQFSLGVEDPRRYGDYVKYAAAKRREEAEKQEAERRQAAAAKRKGRRAGKRYTRPGQEQAAEKALRGGPVAAALGEFLEAVGEFLEAAIADRDAGGSRFTSAPATEVISA